MRDMLLRSILIPLSTRAGTAAATYLLAQGYGGVLGDRVAAWIAAGVLIALDLIANRAAPSPKKEAP